MQDCQVFLVIGGSKRPIRNYSYFINVDEQAQNVHGVKKIFLDCKAIQVSRLRPLALELNNLIKSDSLSSRNILSSRNTFSTITTLMSEIECPRELKCLPVGWEKSLFVT